MNNHNPVQPSTEISQLLQTGLVKDAVDRLTDFAYLLSRIEAHRVSEIVADMSAVLQVMPTDLLLTWRDWILERSHLFCNQGAVGMLQSAIAEADTSAITRAAENWLTHTDFKQPWLRRLGRPQATAQGPCLMTLVGHRHRVAAVVIHPDGLRAVSAAGQSLRVWDLATGACLRVLDLYQFLDKTGDPLEDPPCYGEMYALAIHPDGRRAVSGGFDREEDHLGRSQTLWTWDLETGECISDLSGHTGSVNDIVIHPDGKRVLSASDDGTVRVWDLESGTCLMTLDGHTSQVKSLAILSNGKLAVSAALDDTLRLWDLDSGECLECTKITGSPTFATATYAQKHNVHSWEKTMVRPVAIHAKGQAVFGISNSEMLMYSNGKNTYPEKFSGHGREILAVAIHPDGLRAVSGSADTTLRVWDLQGAAVPRYSDEHAGPVSALVMHADGRRLISGSLDRTLRVWDVKTGECLRVITGNTGSVRAIAMHPDGDRVLSADDKLRIWDLQTGQLLNSIEIEDSWHFSFPTASAVLPDGCKTLVLRYGSNTPTILDIRTGACVGKLEGHTKHVNEIAVHPNGRICVSASEDTTLRVWDLDTGTCLKTLTGHQNGVRTVLLHPDGRRAISSADDRLTTRVWDLNTGKCLHTLQWHKVEVLALLPDGRRAIIGGRGLRIWDIETGACLHELESHKVLFRAIAVFSDGTRAVTASADNSLRVWDVDRGTCIAQWNWDFSIRCCAVAPSGGIALGDAQGNTLFLRMID